jgi:RNA polymerase sigma-70 factor (ECF subfamily)
MDQADDDAVGRAQEGDLAAFKTLVDRYKKRIYSIAYQMTGNHSDADDAAQETFIRAYRGLRYFKGQSNFYTWLYRIMINCCMDVLRKRKRRGEIELNEALDADVYAGDSRGADRDAQLGELRGAVRQALASLPRKQRMALVLHEFDGIPHAEIAKIMRCSEGTVRSRLHYARLRMQEKLKKFL